MPKKSLVESKKTTLCIILRHNAAYAKMDKKSMLNKYVVVADDPVGGMAEVNDQFGRHFIKKCSCR